jgi:hypothetical protein
MRSADYSPMLTFDSGAHQVKAFRRALSGRAGRRNPGAEWVVVGVTGVSYSSHVVPVS